MAYLISKDILKSFNALKGKDIDLLITAGNAGLVTVPSNGYKEYLEKNYNLKNVVNIEGYPMAKYVDNYINQENLIDKDEIYGEYGMKEFVLVVFGGDLKDEDIEPLIRSVEELNLKALIAPYRFDRDMVNELVLSPNIKVLPQYVDLLSFMNAASHLIYAAGMGMTIEAGVFNIPSLKIEGFHKTHGSVDLAKELNIPIVKIDEIPKK